MIKPTEEMIQAFREAGLALERPVILRYIDAEKMLEAALSASPAVDPTQYGYVTAISVEKLMCAKLGIEWQPEGMSIVSLLDRLSAPPAGVGVEAVVRKHLEWFERFICDENELNSSTPRKVARNAQEAADELRAALKGDEQ